MMSQSLISPISTEARYKPDYKILLYIKHSLILQLHTKNFLYKKGVSPALYISSIPFRFVYRTADISAP